MCRRYLDMRQINSVIGAVADSPMDVFQLNELIESDQFSVPPLGRSTYWQRKWWSNEARILDSLELSKQLISALETLKILHRIPLVGDMKYNYHWFLQIMLPICDVGTIADTVESNSFKCDEIANAFESAKNPVDVALFNYLCVNSKLQIL